MLFVVIESATWTLGRRAAPPTCFASSRLRFTFKSFIRLQLIYYLGLVRVQASADSLWSCFDKTWLSTMLSCGLRAAFSLRRASRSMNHWNSNIDMLILSKFWGCAIYWTRPNRSKGPFIILSCLQVQQATSWLAMPRVAATMLELP